MTTLDIDDLPSAWSSPGSLFDAVGAQFIAFAIAFAVIANYWVVHHRMIASFAAIDYATITANLFLVRVAVGGQDGQVMPAIVSRSRPCARSERGLRSAISAGT